MISSRVKTVFEHGQFINGPEVKALERRIAKYTGMKHAVAVGSGYDALFLTLGVVFSKYFELITTPFTFGATLSAAINAGANPRFVDIGDDLQIDVEQAISLAEKIGPSHFLTVDLFGGSPNYNRLKTCNGLIIEDAAQAFGAEYDGKPAGSLGDIGCFSFHPSKLLGACGDAGMVVTNDDRIADKIKLRANHGMPYGSKYLYMGVGVNSRMDSIQAAILLDKLDNFDKVLAERRIIASVYRRSLPCVKHPIQDGGIRRPSFSIYPVLFENEKQRCAAQLSLTQAGCWSRIYYPKPLHLQPAFEHLGHVKGDFPKAEKASETILALPMEITMEKIGQVIDIVRGACEVK